MSNENHLLAQVTYLDGDVLSLRFWYDTEGGNAIDRHDGCRLCGVRWSTNVAHGDLKHYRFVVDDRSPIIS